MAKVPGASSHLEKGLLEFLAACGIRWASWGTEAQASVSHEVDRVSQEAVGESPRRIVFGMAKGLPVFLAACGVLDPSCGTPPRGGVSHEAACGVNEPS